MNETRSLEEDRAQFVMAALDVANELCTAVMRGAPGQQRLALNFARIIDDAKRAGHILIKSP